MNKDWLAALIAAAIMLLVFLVARWDYVKQLGKRSASEADHPGEDLDGPDGPHNRPTV